MERPVSFLSDYGVGDDFAGVCRAVIARIAPQVRVIDISHGIPRHDIRAAASVLTDLIPFSPPAVHLAIVDPGVGTERRPVAVSACDGEHLFVGPDNGLLPAAIDCAGGIDRVVDIGSSPLRLEPASATFHGRDVFAPIAAHLAAGVDLGEVGEAVEPAELVRGNISAAVLDGQRALAHVDRVDGFGNVALDLSAADLAGHPLAGASRVSVGAPGGRRTATRGTAFDDVEDGGLIFYADSSNRMAIAVNRASAAELLEVRTGDQVELEPAP